MSMNAIQSNPVCRVGVTSTVLQVDPVERRVLFWLSVITALCLWAATHPAQQRSTLNGAVRISAASPAASRVPYHTRGTTVVGGTRNALTHRWACAFVLRSELKPPASVPPASAPPASAPHVEDVHGADEILHHSIAPQRTLVSWTRRGNPGARLPL